MSEQNIRLARARLLIKRLERLSADSLWAHKASGVRASLDKLLARTEGGYDPDRLDTLVQSGFDILARAAGTIPPDDDADL